LPVIQQCVGIEVVDPRELELPAAGLVTFVDPETGAAHGVYEEGELNGVYDQNWPAWYAAYLVEQLQAILDTTIVDDDAT
jgi:hypothetical protein